MSPNIGAVLVGNLESSELWIADNLLLRIQFYSQQPLPNPELSGWVSPQSINVGQPLVGVVA